MIEVKGSNTEAKIYTNNPQETAIAQIEELCNQEFMKDLKIRIMPDYHAGKGCVIGTTIKIEDKVVPNLVGVDVGCLDKDTEFLTDNGWKKMNEYTEGDTVLQYDKDTDTARFVEPIHYIVKDCDEFIHFKNQKGLDQMLSDEHKVLLWKGYKSKGYNLIDSRADEILEIGNKLDKGYYGVKTSFNIDNGSGLDLTGDEIRLDVMIAADGCIKYERNDKHQIYMHLRKERKIQRTKEILNANGLEYKETIGKYNSTHIYFFVDKKFNKDLSKYWKASKEQLEIVSSECLLWDGTTGYRPYFSSTDKDSADIIQFAFSSNDIRAGISEMEYKEEGWNRSFIVTPTKNNIIGMTNTATRVKSVDGKKYCFTVPSGYFVARRGGRIFITGNCGILTVQLNEKQVDFAELDRVIREFVPSGQNIHENVRDVNTVNIENFKAKSLLSIDRTNKSLGTLGSGNHFIEVSKDEEGHLYLTIHTGSRYVGAKIAEHYQKVAYRELKKVDSEAVIEQLKAEGRHNEIADTLKKLKSEIPNVKKDLAYLEGIYFDDYIHDMKLAQQYARDNRQEIANIILKHMKISVIDIFDTIHNYIDTDSMILRKGAVSAKNGERLIIPINMRDGSIIAVGKGNPDWNYSAPHGAGRVLSRTKAKAQLKLDTFRETMKDVWSTSVGEDTLDEAPMAYKSMEEIMSQIGDTVDVLKIIKPVYNFKAADEPKFWEKKRQQKK